MVDWTTRVVLGLARTIGGETGCVRIRVGDYTIDCDGDSVATVECALQGIQARLLDKEEDPLLGEEKEPDAFLEIPEIDSTVSLGVNALVLVCSREKTYSFSQWPRAWEESKREMFESTFQFTVNLLNDPANSKQRLCDLPFVSPQDQSRLLENLRGPEWQVPDLLLHEWFERACDAHPDRSALAMSGRKDCLSYSEVDTLANQLAHWLLSKYQLDVEDRVCVHMPRGFDQIITVLAIMKTGAVYVPIDMDFPQARVDAIQSDSGAKATVTSIPPLQGFPTHRPSRRGSPTNLMCILYTSGSTGKPKGVELTHQWWASFAAPQHLERIALDQSRVLMSARLSWGPHILAMLFSAASAGTLCLVPEEKASNLIIHFQDLMEELQVNLVICAPSLLSTFKRKDNSTLRTAILAGAQCPKHIVAHLTDEGVNVITHYGATEAGPITEMDISSASFESTKSSGAPVGRAMANVEVMLLDSSGTRVVPQGSIGELYVSKIGLARGYHHLRESSEESFVHNPFSNRFDIMYKTGDMARAREDGCLELLGRRGTSAGFVKVRGFRVELGEVTAVLEIHEHVQRALVVVERDRLVAFVQATDSSVTEAELSELCKQHLVNYMVPDVIFLLQEIPLNANGKDDLPALTAMLYNSVEDVATQSAPRTTMEVDVANVWASVLGVDHVTREMDFFVDCCGTSITAAFVVARLQTKLGVSLSVAQLFETPVLKTYAAVLDASPKEAVRGLTRLPEKDRVAGQYPLIPLQKRLALVHAQLPESHSSNSTRWLQLLVSPQVSHLNIALRGILARHQVLCTRYDYDATNDCIRDNGVVERSWAETATVTVLNSDDELDTFRLTPMDLSKGPSLRAAWNPSSNITTLVFHHIAIDGWCAAHVLSDFATFLLAAMNDEEPVLKPLEYDFLDYAYDLSLRTVDEAAVDYWVSHLLGNEGKIPISELYRDFGDQVPKEPITYLAPAVQVVSSRVPFIAGSDASCFSLYLTALALALRCFSDQDNIVFAAYCSQRTRPELADIAGMLVEILGVRVDARDDLSLEEMLERVRTHWNQSTKYRHVPWSSVVSRLRQHGHKGNVYSYLFNFRGELLRGTEGTAFKDAFEYTTKDVHDGHRYGASADLEITLDAYDGKTSFLVSYRSDIWLQSTAHAFVDTFVSAVSHMCDTVKRSMSVQDLVSLLVLELQERKEEQH